MEISPIAGIRVLPVTRVRPIQPELTASFDIEAVARPSDDTYSSSRRKAAGAEESEEEAQEPIESETGEEATAPRAANLSAEINFFA